MSIRALHKKWSALSEPVLEASDREAPYAHDRRTRDLKEAFGRVCADRAWSVRFETDYGLRWDHERECWADAEGHHYDGARLRSYARAGQGV